MSLLEDLIARIETMDPKEKQELATTVMAATQDEIWVPNEGPQLMAYETEADELFYGGSAGGGKTDLIVGLSLTQHTRSLILRRTNKEASKLFDRYLEVIGHRDGWNGQEHTWRIDGRTIDIGGVQHEDDKQKYKGTPHDLVAWDEVSDFTETQFRFINTWNRSADPDQRCRVVCAGNPPTRPEGLWVLKYWGPWLDTTHPRPAKPGELRWFTTIAGEDQEVDGPGPHLVDGEMVRARSRTFIPAMLSDNPDLARTNYAATLAALPAELRAAYKEGRFDAGLRDHEWQVIPTEWIMEAQNRWKRDGWKEFSMTAMGYDPAGGGKDSAALVWRHGDWFSEVITSNGPETADGSLAAALILKHRRDEAAIIVDVGGGYGGQTVMRLKDNGVAHTPFNGANATGQKTNDRMLRFHNARAEAWWRMREALDPERDGGSLIALPPDPEVRADLAAPTYEVGPQGIKLIAKEKLRLNLGRSPDKGDAIVMCWASQDVLVRKAQRRASGFDRPKFANVGYADQKKRHRIRRSR